MASIYIVPNSGQYEGKLLVFDYVESMNHVSTSKIPQHPVESLERSSADHRFREGVKIQITGNISDNWTSSITEVPSPVFQTLVFKRQKLLRQEVAEETGNNSYTTKLVNKILDKEPIEFEEYLRVPVSETYFYREADRLLKIEKDALSLASDKEMSLSDIITNNYTLGQQINTIAQAEEMLRYLDDNSTLLTVVSQYRTYENMVLTNYSNPLRNGAERGAYWVSLNLEQQLLATTVSSPIAISARDSEEVNEEKNKGKQAITSIPTNSKAYKEVNKIWDQEVADFPQVQNKITSSNKEEGLQEAARTYIEAGDNSTAATTQTRRSIKGTLITINNRGVQ